jgi:hypothetical protein
MPNLTSRDKFRIRNVAIRMTLPLLVITMFTTVLLSSCGPSPEERMRERMEPFSSFRHEPSIWDNRFVSYAFKILVIVCIGGVVAAFRGKGGNPPNTTQPTQPKSDQPKPPTQPLHTTTPVASPPPQTPSGAIWFYREGGKEFGPFTQDALTQLVACNVIARTTEIRRQGGAWVTYTDVFGV